MLNPTHSHPHNPGWHTHTWTDTPMCPCPGLYTKTVSHTALAMNNRACTCVQRCKQAEAHLHTPTHTHIKINRNWFWTNSFASSCTTLVFWCWTDILHMFNTKAHKWHHLAHISRLHLEWSLQWKSSFIAHYSWLNHQQYHYVCVCWLLKKLPMILTEKNQRLRGVTWELFQKWLHSLHLFTILDDGVFCLLTWSLKSNIFF